MLNPEETTILDQALLALKKETGLDFTVDANLISNYPESRRADTYLIATEHIMAVEVKRNIRPPNLGGIINQVKSLTPQGILIADYINPNIAEKLKESEVQYIDSCGNAYINLSPIFVSIKGQKPKLENSKKKNKAFNLSGLKLVYGLLCDDTLINSSYREISETTGVALGAIGTLLNDLRDSGYLLNSDDLRWHGLINRKKLLDRWVEAYPEKLRPKLVVGEFVSQDPNWWKKINIENYDAYWGEEIAAAKYTDYLRPQVATIYLPEESGNEIFINGRLRKALSSEDKSEGLVKIYRPFWPTKHKNKNLHILNNERHTVNPILIYADLIASQDSRNLETARIIYDTAIAELIGEN